MYTLVCTNVDTKSQDFEEDIRHRNAAVRAGAQAAVQSEQDPEEGDHAPCPEDEEFFAPFPEDEEFLNCFLSGLMQRVLGVAIGKFLDGLEGQER